MWALLGLILFSVLPGSDSSRVVQCETCSAAGPSCSGLMVTCLSFDYVCMSILTVNATWNYNISRIDKHCITKDNCFARQENMLKNKKDSNFSVTITCTRNIVQQTASGSLRLAPSGLSLWVVLGQLVAGGFGVSCISVSLEAILGLSKLTCPHICVAV